MEVLSVRIEVRGQRRWQAFKGLARPPYLGHLHKAPLVTLNTGETVSIHRPKSLKPRNKDVTLSGKRLGSESLIPGGALSSRDPSLVLLPQQHQGLPGCIRAEGRVPGTGAQKLTGAEEGWMVIGLGQW